MKIKSQRDFGSGLLFVVLGGVFAMVAGDDSLGTPAEPGAGFFPLILSVALMVLGALVLFKALTLVAAIAMLLVAVFLPSTSRERRAALHDAD